MRFLSFSLLVLFTGCAFEYAALKPTSTHAECNRHIPLGKLSGWYDAAVDVVGRHLSGLVLVKPMDDQSVRVVFTNEAGVTFFDFQFGPGNNFSVKSIISSLDKKPVINTLRKDFELMLGIPFQDQTAFKTWATDDELFIGVEQGDKTDYFVTDKNCSSLHRIESGSKRKRLVSIQITDNEPQKVSIKHYTFDMVIRLTKMEKE